MRLLSAFLLFAFTLLGCHDLYKADYSVNCEFLTTTIDGLNTLVVTDFEGKVLQSFEIPTGVSSFSGKVTTLDKDAPAYYDLHLIYRSKSSPNSGSIVYSQLGVKNGSVTMMNNNFPFIPTKAFNFYELTGILSLEQFNITDWDQNQVNTYLPNEATIKGALGRRDHQAHILRLRANGDPQMRYLYLSDSLLEAQSNLSFSWQDFKPESNFLSVSLAGGEIPEYLRVTAVDDAFRNFAILFGTNNVTNGNAFNLPDELPSSMHNFAVLAEGKNIRLSKIFKSGEPLQFGEPGIKISGLQIVNNQIKVTTEGDVDLLRIDNITGEAKTTSWQISGRPSDFLNLKIPDLGPWLPDGQVPATLFNHGTLRAYQFDLYDYEQVQAGFPFRSSERFTIARSGYKEVWKDY